MKINGTNYKTIWYDSIEQNIKIIDQTKLPHSLEIITLNTTDDTIKAISEMNVRGAPLIGCTGAFGVFLSCKSSIETDYIEMCCDNLISSRPTAVNLEWAVKRVKNKVLLSKEKDRINIALHEATLIAEEDIENCKSIGRHGLEIIKSLSQKSNETVNILTHCNAGWLATVDWGTATAPIYSSFKSGLDIHVWVDETRPRLQGAFLTSFELNHESVPNTVISDNTGGFLMYKRRVDLCITGADRILSNGDAINKIGTYEKAIAARENNIPFYIAAPVSTIDFNHVNSSDITIEERSDDEMRKITGKVHDRSYEVDIYPAQSNSLNVAFDITPSKFISGIICEHGIFEASEEGIRKIFTKLSE
jgi:methylthioribose-1-phosphate isomerase